MIESELAKDASRQMTIKALINTAYNMDCFELQPGVAMTGFLENAV